MELKEQQVPRITLEDIRLSYLYGDNSKKSKARLRYLQKKRQKAEYKEKQLAYTKALTKSERYLDETQEHEEYSIEKKWADILLGKKELDLNDLGYIKAIGYKTLYRRSGQWRIDDEVNNFLLHFWIIIIDIRKYMMNNNGELPDWSTFGAVITNCVNFTLKQMNRRYKVRKASKPEGVDGVYFGPLNFGSMGEEGLATDQLNKATPYSDIKETAKNNWLNVGKLATSNPTLDEILTNEKMPKDIDALVDMEYDKAIRMANIMKKFEECYDMAGLPEYMTIKELCDLVPYSQEYVRKLLREAKIEYLGPAQRNRRVNAKQAISVLLQGKIK